MNLSQTQSKKLFFFFGSSALFLLWQIVFWDVLNEYDFFVLCIPMFIYDWWKFIEFIFFSVIILFSLISFFIH